MKDWINRVRKKLGFVNNKYMITLFLFFLWILFFDQNNLFEQHKYSKEYKQLLKDKEYYLQKIVEDKKRLRELQTNDENLEKFAREHYLMKKDNEDIFIIVKED